MTYCCEHTRRANELMDSAINWITGTSSHENSSPSGYSESGNMMNLAYEMSRACDTYKDWMSNARSKLHAAKQELSNCNCEREKERLKEQKRDLERNNNELKAFIQNRPSEITHTTSGQRGSSYFRETWTWKK